MGWVQSFLSVLLHCLAATVHQVQKGEAPCCVRTSEVEACYSALSSCEVKADQCWSFSAVLTSGILGLSVGYYLAYRRLTPTKSATDKANSRTTSAAEEVVEESTDFPPP